MKKDLKNQKIRILVQLFFFLFIGFIALNHTLAESGKEIPLFSKASLHAVCPFGGVETLYTLISDGDYVRKIHSSSVILMTAVFFMTIFLGPVFCGWVCPLGSIQEWFGKIGRKIFPKKYNEFVPYSIDSKLRYLRYVFVILILYNTAKAGVLMFLNIDPYYALFNFWTGEVAIWAIIVLLIVFAVSIFIERPWCKYICPYGAVLGIFNTFKIVKIRRNENTCINCNSCSKNCPMNIKVSQSKVVLNHQCISCLKCTSEDYCPVEKTVQFKTNIKSLGLSKIDINAYFIAIVVFIAIFGTVMLSSAFGLWSTTNEKKGNADDEKVAIEYTPEDIRGSFTIKEVGIIFDIPETILTKAFGIPKETDLNVFKSKDIEVLYEESGKEIGNGSLKVFVALYKGLPITLAQDYLPESAVVLIKENNKNLTKEQLEYLEAYMYKNK